MKESYSLRNFYEQQREWRPSPLSFVVHSLMWHVREPKIHTQLIILTLALAAAALPNKPLFAFPSSSAPPLRHLLMTILVILSFRKNYFHFSHRR
jgi:hypothetical protein